MSVVVGSALPSSICVLSALCTRRGLRVLKAVISVVKRERAQERTKERRAKEKSKDGKDKEVEVSKEQDKGKGKDGQRKWGSCFLCGSMDHKKPDCPLKKPKVAAAAVAPEVASSEAAAASASASAGPSSAQLVDEAVRVLKSFPRECAEVFRRGLWGILGLS